MATGRARKCASSKRYNSYLLSNKTKVVFYAIFFGHFLSCPPCYVPPPEASGLFFALFTQGTLLLVAGAQRGWPLERRAGEREKSSLLLLPRLFVVCLLLSLSPVSAVLKYRNDTHAKCSIGAGYASSRRLPSH